MQGDSVVLARGYGVKELGKSDRVDENTLFAIGSSGKSMTAALVSMLVDDGKMRFDDPVWTYLPNFRVAERANGAAPSLPLDKYAATYTDSLSGNVTVSFENGALTLRYNPGFVAKLEPWQYNTFRVTWQNPSALDSPLLFATFNVDASGKAADVRIDGIGSFRAVTPANTRTAASR